MRSEQIRFRSFLDPWKGKLPFVLRCRIRCREGFYVTPDGYNLKCECLGKGILPVPNTEMEK